MNRNFTSALAFATTAAAAVVLSVIASSNARADEISMDTSRFVSSTSRADVRSGVLGQSATLRANSSEYQRTPVLQKSDYTSKQAKSDYIADRAAVNAMNAEDSGAAYYARQVRSPRAAAILGAPAR